MSHPSAVEALAAKLAAAIMTGELAGGTWLRQEAIAEQYGVSRQPVREALRQLQAYGMVDIPSRRGALVRRPSPRDIREAYQVRAELEGLAAALAARHVTTDDLRRMREAEERFERVVAQTVNGEPARHDGDSEVVEWNAANDAFHEAVLTAAGAQILRRTIETLHLVVPRGLTWNALRTRRLLESNVIQHRSVRSAIESGDEETARAAMREHISSSGTLIAEWFERQEGR